uniref:ENTH domain-containing protein n=1 Tax=Rhabditophanes sp. KR3021 TaxID=114890 RepID=A0AC35TZM3_9BILA
MSISTIRRQMKNVALNYSDAQVKVREATSNDPWGPTTALMSDIADLTYQPPAFNDIMTLLFKRLNDHGKNWRHVYKSLVLLDYLIKCGSDRVPQQCRENFFIIDTLKDFQHYEEGRDQGSNVREKAKQMVALLNDEELLKTEREKHQQTRRKFLHQSGISSDGTSSTRVRNQSELEDARPTNENEEEIQLQIALALSREECEKDEELRKGYEMRLKTALEESKKEDGPTSSQYSKQTGAVSGSSFEAGSSFSKPQSNSIIDDLLSLDFGTPAPAQQHVAPINQANGFGNSDPWAAVQETITTITTSHPSVPLQQNGGANFDPWATPLTHNGGHPTGLPSYDEITNSSSSANADPWAIPESGMSHHQSTADNFNFGTSNLNESNLNKQRGTVKTPETFLGENANLVNMDNLMGVPTVPLTQNSNPFLASIAPTTVNPFLAQQRPSPSLNQMMSANRPDQQTPIPSSMQQNDIFKKPLKVRVSEKFHQVKDKCSIKNCKRGIYSIFPVLYWLPRYQWKSSFFNDLSGGLTLAVFALPQGMAHASIINLDPIYGLYTSIFASFTYFMFGHSRHIALGTFAILSLMTDNAIQIATQSQKNKTLEMIEEGLINATHITLFNLTELSANATEILDLTFPNPSIINIKISATLTFCVGIFHLMIGQWKREFWSCYVSEQVLSGFVVGGTVHVFFSQIGDALGIPVPKRSGTGYLYYRIQDLFYGIQDIHLPTTIITTGSLFFLLFCREILNVELIRIFKTPVPYELLLVIVGTTATNFGNLLNLYKVKVVGVIPSTIPLPHLPDFQFVPSVIWHAFIISIVSGAVHMSVVKIVEKRYNCQINSSEELRSLGFVSIFSSLFPTFTVTSGFARSVFGVAASNCSQFTSFFTGLTLLLLILFIAPALQYLPKSILATMIIVAQKASLQKTQELKNLWPMFKVDFFIFIVSFICTVCFDMAMGLALSVGIAILTTVIRSQYPRWHIISKSNENGQFEETSRKDIEYIDSPICIMRMDGPLIFTSVQKFMNAIRQSIKLWEKRNDSKNSKINSNDIMSLDWVKRNRNFPLIIDCSAFLYVDYQGMCAMIRVYNELKSQGIFVYFAGAKRELIKMFQNSEFISVIPAKVVFPTLDGAVEMVKAEEYKRNEQNVNRSEESGQVESELILIKQIMD